MDHSRRYFVAGGIGLGIVAMLVGTTAYAALPNLIPDSPNDQTDLLQRLVDEAALRRQPVILPAGRINFRTLTLRPGTKLIGTSGLSILRFIGGGASILATQANDIRLEGFTVDGALLALDSARAEGLITIRQSTNVQLVNLEVRNSLLNGIVLNGNSGRVTGCTITLVALAGLYSMDAKGLNIDNNRIASCNNNGILVWRSAVGEDGTIVANNRIEKISAGSGGTGQNGNGVNVFRAGNVLVSGNRIADCAYSAVRGNAASDIQIVGNNCQRSGEVALYAEFGFEGALIANNLIDTAASGIAVTNFNVGGRLAVVQGNLIRNLFRRETEPQDKRGDGISVEADSLVAGNTIENAPSFGIFVGWGSYMRDVTVTGNLIRKAKIGIALQNDPTAGAVLVAQNMIAGSTDGAIRSMAYGVAVGPDLVGPGLVGTNKSGRITILANVAS
jgi:uncharacterized secreted repeat protein (TIGR03808 family)